MMEVSDTYNSEMGLSASFLILGHCSSVVATIPSWLVDHIINKTNMSQYNPS